MCLWVIRHQEIDDSLHHEWGVGLSWMDPSSDHDTLFLLVDLERHPISDGEVLTLVASYSPTKRVSRDIVQMLWLNFTKIFCQIGISVWLWVSEVDLIMVVLEGVGECESVVAPLVVRLLRLVLSVVVLIVREVLASSLPTLLALFFLLGGRWKGSGLFLLLFRID